MSTREVFPSGEMTSSGEPRRFHYELRLTVRGVWDDNIFISHTNRVSDYYFAIEPEITIGVGDMEGRSRSYLRLDYMPSAILFVDHSDEDAFNQLIHLEGGYSTGRLKRYSNRQTSTASSTRRGYGQTPMRARPRESTSSTRA